MAKKRVSPVVEGQWSRLREGQRLYRRSPDQREKVIVTWGAERMVHEEGGVCPIGEAGHGVNIGIFFQLGDVVNRREVVMDDRDEELTGWD
jgi:hypothetical protein